MKKPLDNRACLGCRTRHLFYQANTRLVADEPFYCLHCAVRGVGKLPSSHQYFVYVGTGALDSDVIGPDDIAVCLCCQTNYISHVRPVKNGTRASFCDRCRGTNGPWKLPALFGHCKADLQIAYARALLAHVREALLAWCVSEDLETFVRAYESGSASLGELTAARVARLLRDSNARPIFAPLTGPSEIDALGICLGLAPRERLSMSTPLRSLESRVKKRRRYDE